MGSQHRACCLPDSHVHGQLAAAVIMLLHVQAFERGMQHLDKAYGFLASPHEYISRKVCLTAQSYPARVPASLASCSASADSLALRCPLSLHPHQRGAAMSAVSCRLVDAALVARLCTMIMQAHSMCIS